MDQKFVLDFEKPIYNLAGELEALNECAAVSDVDFSKEFWDVNAGRLSKGIAPDEVRGKTRHINNEIH
jgi:hypothetical protein